MLQKDLTIWASYKFLPCSIANHQQPAVPTMALDKDQQSTTPIQTALQKNEELLCIPVYTLWYYTTILRDGCVPTICRVWTIPVATMHTTLLTLCRLFFELPG
jgi:hypothetical protein